MDFEKYFPKCLQRIAFCCSLFMQYQFHSVFKRVFTHQIIYRVKCYGHRNLSFVQLLTI
jgi:hypothetical protein